MGAAHQPTDTDRTIACPGCDQLHRYRPIPQRSSARCSRCGTTLYAHRVDPINRTLALAITGLIAFIPANAYPVMTFHFNGRAKNNLLVTGPEELFAGGLDLVALLVLLTSIIAPLLKFTGLIYLLLPIALGSRPRRLVPVEKLLTFFSRWAMLDVYLLAMLVATVKLGMVGHITASTGLFALLGLILLSIATSLSFEPEAVWRRLEAGP